MHFYTNDLVMTQKDSKHLAIHCGKPRVEGLFSQYSK